ncbi:RHS repeat-associated core domain-containing protein [Pseudomonas putida]|nr:RHS repeat-associated core domain-containing protein [Pseudomonas putida]
MGGGDVGYGEGWDLNLSRFVEHAYPEGGSALSLFTGEQFTVDGIEGISEKKLDTFHFHKDGDGRFRVVHRSGVVEILETMGAGTQRAALPTRIYAPTGQWIELKYASNPNIPGWFCLTEVRNGHAEGEGKGHRLLEVKYGGAIEFIRYPDADDVRASHVLQFIGRELRYAVMPDQTQWAFEYRTVHRQTCVTKVISPSGAVENIEYGVDGDPGHALPNVTRKLPRVKRHRVDPGHGQPEMCTDYDYSAENYMGNGSGITWRNNGQDNLYEVVKPEYSYWSMTTQRCEGQADRTVKTHYDRFHRTTSEVRKQGKEITRTTIAYHGKLTDPFSKQPPTFQMARTVTTAWEMEDDANKKRSEFVTTEYDDDGNLTKEIRTDGSYTELKYFPAEGEPGRCPAEPNGFKKHVKSQTVHPSDADKVEKGAIPLRTDFTYAARDIAYGRPDVPERGKIAATWVAMVTEHVFDASDAKTPREITTVERCYLDTPSNTQLHGRLSKRVTTLIGEHDGTELGKVLASAPTTVEWKYGLNTHPALGEVFQTTQTTTGYDQHQKVSKQSKHALTGQVLENLDMHKTVTRYSYDASNRPISETSAPDDMDRKAKIEYRYRVSADRNYQETEDNLGVISRMLFDGLNRPIKEERVCEAVGSQTRAKQTYEVWSAKYNAFGQLAEETTYDHLPTGERALTSTHRYDNWGNRCATKRPDRVIEFTDRSPFGTDGDIVTTWERYPDQPRMRKNLSITTFNRFDKPEQVQLLDEQGTVESTRAYRYDGFGRSVEETHTFAVPASGKRTARINETRTTTYQYDVWGRVQRTDRADDSALSRTFARHSTDELATSLLLHPAPNAKGIPVCTREFDDIDRLVSMTVGPYQETREYPDEQMLPEKRVMKSGRTMTYKYDLAVGTAPTDILVGKNQKPSKFKYSMASAAITEAQNEQGTHSYGYTDQGYLLSESWAGKQPGDNYTRTYLTSLQGLLLESSDSDNCRKVYEYDELERLTSISQGTLHAVLTYNSAGLLHTTLTTSSAKPDSVQQLLCTHAYDHRRRETSRALKLTRLDANGKEQVLDERTVVQKWRGDNMLASRELIKAGQTVLTETFDYDNRDRLYNHKCEGSLLPTNSKGRAITNQMWEFDAYDNILLCFTEFADGKTDDAFYEYHTESPFQLKSVSHSLTDDYDALVTFNLDDYDADGNMLKDEQGNRLEYDEDTGYLAKVTAQDGTALASYRYDGHGKLLAVRHGTEAEERRHYEGYRVSSTLRDGLLTQYLCAGELPLGLQQSGTSNETRLYMANNSNSVLAECASDDTVHEANYSAYGEAVDSQLLGMLGFNAEACERVLGWYLLGCGYRAYNTRLMRFQSPDNVDPEVGGINPYVYCMDNPVMFQDPTGHYSRGWGSNEDPKKTKEKRGAEFWLNIGIMVMNVALTVGFAVATAGAATPLTMAIIAVGVTATVAAAATQVAAEFTKDPKKKKKLVIGSLSLSIIGLAFLSAGMAKGGIDKAKAAKKARLAEANGAGAGNGGGDGDGGTLRRQSSAPEAASTQSAGVQTDNVDIGDINNSESRRASNSLSEPYSAPITPLDSPSNSRRNSLQAPENVQSVSTDATPLPPGYEMFDMGGLVEIRSKNGLHKAAFSQREIAAGLMDSWLARPAT